MKISGSKTDLEPANASLTMPPAFPKSDRRHWRCRVESLERTRVESAFERRGQRRTDDDRARPDFHQLPRPSGRQRCRRRRACRCRLQYPSPASEAQLQSTMRCKRSTKYSTISTLASPSTLSPVHDGNKIFTLSSNSPPPHPPPSPCIYS